MRLLISTLLLIVAPLSGADGFRTGNNFEARKLEGHIRVRCQGRSSSYQRCSRWTLFPVEYAFFTAGDIEADHVELVATQPDGRVVRKSSPYSSEKSRSTKRVNLWIDTVLQTPLLDVGVNSVEYRMLQQGEVIKQGTFSAEITVDKQPQYCPDMVIHSRNDSDCRSPSRMCATYFQRLNYSCN